jgi:branched-chain amino acid aminotransferase
MHAYVLYNEDIVPAGANILSPGQLGLLSGWGVFSTLRIYDGVPFAFERHWKRLSRDAAMLHIELPKDAAAVRQNLLRLIEANGAANAPMRICVFRSQGGVWEGPGSGRASDLVAMTADLKGWQESVSLSIAEQGRHAASAFAGTKTLSWAHNLTMAENAQHQGFDEVILLNERGEVAECTSANIFAVRDGATYTPPLSSGPLPGVTRAVMLEELNVAGAPVQESILRPDDLYAADEVFITSTTRELLPVHEIAGKQLSKAGGGWPVMHQLQAALTAYIRRYIDQSKAA